MTNKITHLAALLKNSHKIARAESFNLPKFPQVLVDGPSTNPIINIQAIKPNQTIRLLGITTKPSYQTNHTSQKYWANGECIYPIGTITVKNKLAAQKLQDCFLINGKLANENQLFVGTGAKLKITGGVLPHKLILTDYSELILAGNCHINNVWLTKNSHLNLSRNSVIKDAYLENVSTGKYQVNNQGTPYFTLGAVKVQITATDQVNYLSNCNLEYNNQLRNVNLSYTTLQNATCRNTIIKIAKTTNCPMPNSNTITATTLDDVALVKDHDTGRDPVKTAIVSSNLKHSVILTTNGNQTIMAAKLFSTMIINDASAPQGNDLNEVTFKNVIIGSNIKANQVEFLATKTKPIVTNQRINLQDVRINTTTGGLLIDNLHNDIDFEQGNYKQRLQIANGEAYQDLVKLNSQKLAPTITVKTLGHTTNDLPPKYDYAQMKQTLALIKRTINNQ